MHSSLLALFVVATDSAVTVGYRLTLHELLHTDMFGAVWIWISSQAMVHELLGIQDNRVDLTKLPKVPKDLQVWHSCTIVYYDIQVPIPSSYVW